MKTRPQILLALATGCTLAFLAGCGTDVVNSSASGALQITGNVHGGQQAVVGARIRLYDAGATGNGSAATDRLTVAVLSGVNGGFNITGDYTCPNASDQMYIVATGGNPGLSTTNSSIALVAALGRCGTLLANASTTFITINEVTTAAAAWSLGSFATGPANVGASATNGQGIANAMSNAALLANTTTGLAASKTGQIIETRKLYALADALATCVNSTGSACSGLFTAATPPGGAAPTDTFTAALNVVHYPGNNVAAIFNQVSASPPFAPALTAAPSDWTMSDTITLPGTTYVPSPQQLAIDGTGTVWTADYYNATLLAVTPQGALLSTTGFGRGVLDDPNGVTVDALGNVWVSNAYTGDLATTPNGSNGALTKFQSTTGTAPGTVYMTGVGGTAYFYDANTLGPDFLAADAPTAAGNPATGNILYSDYFGGVNSEVFNDAGTLVSTTTQGGGPVNSVFDTNHGLWIPDTSFTDVVHLVNGTATSITCCQVVGESGQQSGSASNGAGLGLDRAGNLWITSIDTNFLGYVSEISNANAVLINSATTDNIASAVAVGDAGGVMWFANVNTSPGTIAAISSGTGASGPGATTAGSSFSPAGGFGVDAGMGYPDWLAPDGSGNLWVSDAENGALVLFFGLATPTATPQLALPTAP